MYQADGQEGIDNVNYQHNDPMLRVLYGEGLPRIEFPPTRWQRFKSKYTLFHELIQIGKDNADVRIISVIFRY
jgi:hypothetical protein